MVNVALYISELNELIVILFVRSKKTVVYLLGMKKAVEIPPLFSFLIICC